jgi:hypothetical protein
MTKLTPAARAPRRTHLGWLGPVVVLVGVVAAGAAIWYMRAARPVPGEVIDRFVISIDPHRAIVLREEANGEHSFIEMREGETVRWQALIPRYAGSKGRPAIAWSDRAVTVRVERSGRAEVFAFALDTAQKIGAFRLAPEHEPIETEPTGPITFTDHVRSYEIVGGTLWHQLIAIDLVKGIGIWKVDVGDAPIEAIGEHDGRVWISQRGVKRWFDAATGRDTPDAAPLN